MKELRTSIGSTLWRVGLLAAALAMAVAPAWALIAERCALASCPLCNCYWSRDCTSGQKCDYSSGCTKSGKLDGTCSAGGSLSVDARQVSEALDAWFEGYLITAREGRDGLPAAEFVEKAVTNGLSNEENGIIRDEVINALDVLLGFDVVIPPGDCLAYDPRCLAQYRIPVENEGAELLEAGRSGLIRAVLTEDPSAVEGALAEYWSRFTFVPHHTGRCYSHGHVEFTETTFNCQTDELGRIAAVLISATANPRQGRPFKH